MVRTVATYQYDGLGRRIVRAIDNSGPLDATYHDYHDGQRLVETRNDSGAVLKQHVWGLEYIDELIQIAVNGEPVDDPGFDPDDADHDPRYYFALLSANYNVMMLLDAEGLVAERYQYEPYGSRTVYVPVDIYDAVATKLAAGTQRVDAAGTTQPYGLCEFGHQGLMHDDASGLICNRARMLNPRLQRFMQWDRPHLAESLDRLTREIRSVQPPGPEAQYQDGMNLFQYVGSNPAISRDPEGLKRYVAVMHGQDFIGFAKGSRAIMSDAIFELRKDADNEVKMFSEDADNSDVVIDWIKDLIRTNPPTIAGDPVIVLVGHSNGADAARKLTTKANRFPKWKGCTIELLFTVDAIGKPFHNWKNPQPVGTIVKKAVNFYQRQDSKTEQPPGFRLHGYELANGENVLWKLDPKDPAEKKIIETPWSAHAHIMLDGGTLFTSTLNKPTTIQRLTTEVSALPRN